MSTAHHKLSPSSAHRWMVCTASVAATADIPDRGSAYADEGTLAHELAAAILTGREASGAPEMLDYVNSYVDLVCSLSGPDRLLLIEQRLDLGEVLPGMFGTGDAIVFDRQGSVWVVDLKYGRGVAVDAERNEQLMLYAVGAKALAELLGIDVSAYHLVISQPRVRSEPSTWVLSAAELDEFIAEAQFAARSIETGAVAYSPGEKTCRWCAVKGSCRARADRLMEIAQQQFSAPPPTLTDDELADLLPQLDELSGWVKDIWAEAEGRLAAGRQVAGWKLVEGRSQRGWSDGAEAWLCQHLGEDAFSRSLIGIPAAEKLLKPLGVPIPAEVIVKPPGRPGIAPEKDPRPAVMTATPEQDFAPAVPQS